MFVVPQSSIAEATLLALVSTSSQLSLHKILANRPSVAENSRSSNCDVSVWSQKGAMRYYDSGAAKREKISSICDFRDRLLR